MDDLEALAARLEATGDYRILRRLKPFDNRPVADGEPTRLGLIVDVETTGLDTATAEIIELAMLPFRYTEDRIVAALPSLSRFNQPAAPIPDEVSRLTGITDDMVAGHSVDVAEIAAFVAPADLVIAHNAAFDRRVLERYCPEVAEKPWACSLEELRWKDAGFASARLGAIAAELGFFFDAHRAIDDCAALLEILARPMRGDPDGRGALSLLREAARRPTARLLAACTPFESKDQLKARGYRWEPGEAGRPKGWFRDLPVEEEGAERAWLDAAVYPGAPDIHRYELTAWTRFSEREWLTSS